MDILNERQQEILNLLKSHKFLTVSALSRMLFASGATIRRDLQKLEAMCLANRTHGGACSSAVSGDLPLALFNKTNVEQKRMIAMQAAKLVRDKDVLFLDATSTAIHIIDYIHHLKGITVFTNGLETAQYAANHDIDTTLVGGKVRAISSCCYGFFAERLLNEVYFDSMFFSVPALSAEGELTHYSPDVIPLLRNVMSRAKNRYLLCIGAKFGTTSTYRICDCSELTGVISELDFPPPIPMLPKITLE